MGRHDRQLESVVRAVRITGQGRFTWLGQPMEAATWAVLRRLDPHKRREVMIAALHAHLYRYFYCSGEPVVALSNQSTSGSSVLEHLLIRQNHGRGTQSPSWLLEDDGRVTQANRDNATKWTIKDNENSPIQQCASRRGSTFDVNYPATLPGVSPGFILMLGDEWLPDDLEEPLIRVYWNVGPRGAVTLIDHLTSALNGARGSPYRLKVLKDPLAYVGRCDALVLYLCASDYAAVVGALAEAYGAVAAGIQPRIPAFTKEIAPGVGLAEGPEKGESFGWNRTGLLALGLMEAQEKSLTRVRERIKAVHEVCEGHGVNLDAPYLRRGSPDLYVAIREPARQPSSGSTAPRLGRPDLNRADRL